MLDMALIREIIVFFFFFGGAHISKEAGTI